MVVLGVAEVLGGKLARNSGSMFGSGKKQDLYFDGSDSQCFLILNSKKQWHSGDGTLKKIHILTREILY